MELDLPYIVVGRGTDCFKDGTNLKHETEAPYMNNNCSIVSGQFLFQRTMNESNDHSLILVLNSGLTDAALAMMNMTDLFLQKVAGVTIMGGVVADGNEVALDDVGFMMPQIGKFGAVNNNFDEASALFVYRFCQENGIPMTILMRDAAYAAQMPFSLYDRMNETHNPIGANLLRRQAHQRAVAGGKCSRKIGDPWQTANESRSRLVREDLLRWHRTAGQWRRRRVGTRRPFPTLRSDEPDRGRSAAAERVLLLKGQVKGVIHQVIGLTAERRCCHG